RRRRLEGIPTRPISRSTRARRLHGPGRSFVRAYGLGGDWFVCPFASGISAFGMAGRWHGLLTVRDCPNPRAGWASDFDIDRRAATDMAGDWPIGEPAGRVSRSALGGRWGDRLGFAGSIAQYSNGHGLRGRLAARGASRRLLR